MSKVWFITGASRGFGRVWAEAALLRGDRVAATARKLSDVAALGARFGDAVLPLALDVTDDAQVKQAVAAAHAHFGRLDVLLNNAGYPLVSTVEESEDAQVQAIFDTNYLGMVRVIRAALPILRAQGSGHILGVSSGLGLVTMPLIGHYCATKWAVEAMHESLAVEVAPFGIRVTLIEPGAYATEFGQGAAQARPIEAYAPLRQQIFSHMTTMERGDPNATAAAVLQLVDTEKPPLRFALGNWHMPRVREAYAGRLAEFEQWKDLAFAAHGEPVKPAAH